MIKSLRKVDFFCTLLATIYETFCSGPPLRKILGAPLNVSQWPWMTTSDKFQRHSFKVAFKLTAKSVRSHILTFDIFENHIAD